MATKPSRDAFQRESESLKARNAERRETAGKIVKLIREARVTDHDKEIIRELSKDRSVDFIAAKMELDLTLTAAIIDGIV